MKINESSWDSVIRIFSGFFLLYLGLGGELGGALAVLAVILGLFSLANRCDWLLPAIHFVQMEKIKGGVPRKEHRRTYIMEPQVFFEKLKQNPRPVVVDLWAPWCGPCKVIKPTLANLAREYQGRVDVWEINADDSQDLLRQLKIYGVPTLIGYQDGQEIARYIGAKPRSELQSFFESLSAGKIPKSSGLSNWDRSIRLMVGTFVVGVAWTNHFHWTILGVGAVIMFSAIYDRCPIWKAITAQLKKIILK